MKKSSAITQHQCGLFDWGTQITCALVLVTHAALPARGQTGTLTIPPSADGTLVDGGPYGPFDGVADNWDWSFNQSSYEGTISLIRDPPQSRVEHRVVWEYSLAGVSFAQPITAKLSFALRGAPRFPAEPARVLISSYPADLSEMPQDFGAGPAAYAGEKAINPYQPLTPYVLNVSSVVNSVLAGGKTAVAFRFQINPYTSALASQAFMDVLDTDPATKPSLVVENTGPGDMDGDRDFDVTDLAGFVGCLSGPGGSPSTGCASADADLDGDVDLADLQLLEANRSVLGR